MVNSSTTTNNDSVIGAINEAIVTGLLEESKVSDGVTYSLKGVGTSKLEAGVNAASAYKMIKSAPESEYTFKAGGIISLPQKEVELPEVEETTTPIATLIKFPLDSKSSTIELTDLDNRVKLDLQTIKEEAIKNGTFLKAPNGNKSNLMEKNGYLLGIQTF